MHGSELIVILSSHRRPQDGSYDRFECQIRQFLPPGPLEKLLMDITRILPDISFLTPIIPASMQQSGNNRLMDKMSSSHCVSHCVLREWIL